jgi:hypothetical protein
VVGSLASGLVPQDFNPAHDRFFFGNSIPAADSYGVGRSDLAESRA